MMFPRCRQLEIHSRKARLQTSKNGSLMDLCFLRSLSLTMAVHTGPLNRCERRRSHRPWTTNGATATSIATYESRWNKTLSGRSHSDSNRRCHDHKFDPIPTREIVLSHVYEIESDAFATTDASNQWLSRFPLRRLEAEMVRDAIFAVSERWIVHSAAHRFLCRITCKARAAIQETITRQVVR